MRSGFLATAILVACAAPLDRAAAANLQQSFNHAKCPVAARFTVRSGECVEVHVKKSDLGDFHFILVFSPGTRASRLVFNDMRLYRFSTASGDSVHGFAKQYLGDADPPVGEDIVLGKVCAREGMQYPPGSHLLPPPGVKEPYRIGVAPEFQLAEGGGWIDFSRAICLEYTRE